MSAVEPWSSIDPDLSRRARSWLSFRRDPLGQTYIAGQRTEYPFHMTRPFRLPADPEGMLTLYLQSSSGGLYRGDRLTLDVNIEEKAALHLTTQAGTVVHHTREGEASQVTNIRIGADGFCEYLPDPLILFSGARLNTRTHAVVEPGATLLLADSFTTHDPGGGCVPFEVLNNELRLESSDGEVLAVDRFEIGGAAFTSGNSALQGGQLSQGTVLLVAPGDMKPVMKELRQSLDSIPGIYAGVSMLPDKRGLWCRFLADDGVALSAALKNAWMAVRSGLTGITPVERRK
jgi:urease accessory protein